MRKHFSIVVICLVLIAAERAHSVPVAREHYLQIHDAHCDRAAQTTQNPTQYAAESARMA